AMAPNSVFPAVSGLFFLLGGLRDDEGKVGIAFFLFLNEGSVVGARLDFYFFNLARGTRALGGGRLLALLLGLGVFERNEFGVRGLGHDRFSFHHRCRRRPRDRCRRFCPRARWRRNDDRNDLAGIGRDHRRLAEIVELAAGFRTDALGAEI